MPCRALPPALLVFLLGLAALLQAAQPNVPAANGDERPEAAAEARALVEQLGDPQFAARERAAGRLSEMGLAAHKALVAGLKHRDAQVRRQSRWILDGVFQLDFQRRLKAFEADTKDERDHGMPGWTRFKKLIGNDAASRELYLSMLKAEAGMLESADAGAEAAAEAISLRMRFLVQPLHTGGRAAISLGSASALLFVICDPTTKLPASVTDNQQIYVLLQQGEFQRALQEKKQPAIRKLVGQWMLRPASIYMVQNKLNLAVTYEIPEGVDLALQLIKDAPAQLGAHFRVQALSAVGILGGKEHLGALSELLKERGEIINGGAKSPRCEVRDVALAWLVLLTGQNLSDYGMEKAKRELETVQKNRRLYFNYATMGFDSQEKRDAAFKKWEEYVADHPLPPSPERPKIELSNTMPNQFRAQRVAQEKKDDEEDLAPGLKLHLADRLLVQSLHTARQLCEDKRFAEGVRLLDDILSADEDFAFQPVVRVPLYRCLKAEAERVLADLPPEGRTTYRLQFEALARTSLAEALKSGSLPDVTAVAERFFHTEAGAEAAFLVANQYLDRDQPFRAALHFRRLRTVSHDANRLEPALSLRLALSCLRSGLTRNAEEVLRDLVRQRGNLALAVAGQPRDWFGQADEGLRWLESLAGKAFTHDDDARGWLMYRGDPTRNPSCDVDAPYVTATPLTALIGAPALREQLEKIRKDYAAQYRAALPRVYPLVVGKLIVFRTATHLQAVEFASGKLVWEAGLEDSLRYYMQAEGEGDKLRTDTVLRGLKKRFWEDLTFGALSSDGRYVFGVEDIPFGFGQEYYRMAVGPDGQRRLDAESMRSSNVLTAHELATGRLHWEIGGPANTGVPMAGARFLGPPLPLGGRLYVCAERDRETRLYELDAATGAPINSLSLALSDQTTDPNMDMLIAMGAMVAPANAGRQTTATPSYADGILVCQIGESQFVGINLATRNVRWVYHLQEPEGNGLGARMFGIAAIRRGQQSYDEQRGDRWSDGSVTIAEGRVLLTPMGSNELICLSLSDGRLEWSAPRRDGLYVGGVRDGRVLVVGRGSLRALELTNGKAAWKHDRLELPAGALPSGYGLMADGRYHLPLSNGEVATVDVRSGRLLSRSRAAENMVPGNLIAAHDAILAQSPEGLWRFETLAGADARIARALEENRGDATLWRQRGEVLLSRGQIDEAVEHLRRALALKADERTRQLLADAVAEGLQADFPRYRKLAEQLTPALNQTERRVEYVRRLARGLLEAGEAKQAFDAYLSLLDVQGLETVDRLETAREVRRDRWLAAGLNEAWQAAEGEARKAIDAAVTARLQGDSLAKSLAYFTWHPAAMPARLQLAQQLAKQGAALAAEQQLWQAIEQGDATQRGAAVAQMAALLAGKNRTDEAVRFYAALRDEYANDVCVDGKTGAQLVTALAAENPVRKRLDQPLVWPRGKAKIENTKDKPAGMNNGMRARVPAAGEGGRFSSAFTCEVDVNQRRIVGRDGLGRERWQLPVGNDQDWNFVHNSQYSYAQIWRRGHFVVAWLGNRVYAFDVTEGAGKQLWRQEGFKTLGPNMGNMPMMMRARQGGLMATGLPGAEMLPLVSAYGCVCYVQDRNLVAFDPLDGKLLWRRDDIEAGSRLFGDGEMLFVVAADGEEAQVVSPLDGREIGRRAVPKSSQWFTALGRRLAVWRSQGDKFELTLLDPWTQATLWRREFDGKAQPALVDVDEAAVLDSQGHFVVLDLPSGAERLAAEIEPVKGLERIFVQRAREQYLLIAGRQASSNNMIFFMPMQTIFRMSGCVAAFERGTGKLQWREDVDGQGVEIDQLTEIPVFVFFTHTQEINNNQLRQSTTMKCLDRRTGRQLGEVTPTTSNNNGNMAMYDVVADPDKWTVDVRSTVGSLKLTYDGGAAAAKDKPSK